MESSTRKREPRNGNATPPDQWDMKALSAARATMAGPFSVYEIGSEGDVEIAWTKDPAQVVARCGSWEQARALVDALSSRAPLLASVHAAASNLSGFDAGELYVHRVAADLRAAASRAEAS